MRNAAIVDAHDLGQGGCGIGKSFGGYEERARHGPIVPRMVPVVHLRNNALLASIPLSRKLSVHDPNDSRFVETGFPSLQWEDDDLPTRPMPLHERPLQARIDHEMAIIAEHHVRIALAIRKVLGSPRLCGIHPEAHHERWPPGRPAPCRFQVGCGVSPDQPGRLASSAMRGR